MANTTKILIVEDEEILADNMKCYLNRNYSNVRIASDAYTATEILEDFTPDLVLLDYGLPGMDGIQTYAKVLQRKVPHASCVMITGQLTDSIARRSGDFGINHVLRKPFSFAELQEVIDLSMSENAVSSSYVKDIIGRIVSTRRHDKDTSINSNDATEDRRASSGRRFDDIETSSERRTNTH
jgi:DNA-binding response OmpR family regulator